MKPCPFCGGSPHLAVEAAHAKRVVCNSCGAQTDTYPTVDEATAAWELRVRWPVFPAGEPVEGRDFDVVPGGGKLKGGT